MEHVHSAIARRSNLPIETVRSKMVDAKVVRWDVAQVIRPMESVTDHAPCSCCATCPASSGLLAVAGDFFTHSSFLGSLSSALCASRAVAACVSSDLA